MLASAVKRKRKFSSFFVMNLSWLYSTNQITCECYRGNRAAAAARPQCLPSLIKKQAVEVFCLACFKFMMAPLERFVHRSISKSVKVNLPNLNNNNNQIKKKCICPGFSNVCKPENILTNFNYVHCSPQRTFLFPRSSFNAHFRIRSFLKGKRQKKVNRTEKANFDSTLADGKSPL